MQTCTVVVPFIYQFWQDSSILGEILQLFRQVKQPRLENPRPGSASNSASVVLVHIDTSKAEPATQYSEPGPVTTNFNHVAETSAVPSVIASLQFASDLPAIGAGVAADGLWTPATQFHPNVMVDWSSGNSLYPAMQLTTSSSNQTNIEADDCAKRDS